MKRLVGASNPRESGGRIDTALSSLHRVREKRSPPATPPRQPPATMDLGSPLTPDDPKLPISGLKRKPRLVPIQRRSPSSPPATGAKSRETQRLRTMFRDNAFYLRFEFSPILILLPLFLSLSLDRFARWVVSRSRYP